MSYQHTFFTEQKHSLIAEVNPFEMVLQILIKISWHQWLIQINLDSCSNEIFGPSPCDASSKQITLPIFFKALSATCTLFDVRGIPSTRIHREQMEKLKLLKAALGNQHLKTRRAPWKQAFFIERRLSRSSISLQ